MGTFGDAAARMQSWHFLRQVLRIAGVSDLAELDRVDRPRSISRQLPPAKLFKSISLDGSDPSHVPGLFGKSILACVKNLAKFRHVGQDYAHPFWKHLKTKDPIWPGRETWVDAQLKRHGLVVVDMWLSLDAVKLGLTDAHTRSAPLILSPEQFATLDGLLLLLILYRRAIDLLRFDQAQPLSTALHEAASLFSRAHRYDGELHHTWVYLMNTRMLRWDPNMQPCPKSVVAAQIVASIWRTPLRICAADFILLGKGRSDRRQRRKVWIKACFWQFAHRTNWDFVTSDPVYKWVAANSAEIRAHIDLILSGQCVNKDLLPLAMPTEIYRKRKQRTRCNVEPQLRYDLIPVTEVKDTEPK